MEGIVMLEKYPVFKSAKIIPQPNVCFSYCKDKNVFDVLNKSALAFMWRMNGLRSGEQILEEIQSVFPHINNNVIINDYKALVSYLQKRGYLVLENGRTEETFCVELENKKNKVKPVHAEIELTRNCNLSCAYCYANVGKGHHEDDLPFDRWKEVLTELKEDGLRVVKVSGGEPFLYKGIKSFMEFCSEHFIVSLNTNGWFIDKKTAEWLSELNLLCVQISLDSASKEWHNKIRGKNSWDKAMEAIENLYDCGVALRISSTIGMGNRNEILGIREIAERFSADTNFEIMKPTGRATALQDKWFVGDTCEITRQNTVSPIYKSLDYLEIKCQAQLGFVGISSKGNIKPCNLPETFFSGLKVDVVSAIVPGSFNYSSSDTCRVTEDYCAKVVAALPREGGRSYDRCIFYYSET